MRWPLPGLNIDSTLPIDLPRTLTFPSRPVISPGGRCGRPCACPRHRLAPLTPRP